jgi:hypothetical protein
MAGNDMYWLRSRNDVMVRSSASPRVIDPDELAYKCWQGRDSVVDPSGLGRGVRVFAAHDDARMDRASLVEADEIAPIQGEHGATGACREVEDFGIGDRLPRMSRFLRREHVVAERAQGLHRAARKFSFA